jgi:hypothetical protein
MFNNFNNNNINNKTFKKLINHNNSNIIWQKNNNIKIM